MKINKEYLYKSILYFAKIFGNEVNYKALISSYAGTPKIVEMIVYDMFLNKFNSYHCTDEKYEHYKIIYKYSTELKENGWVLFE
jgi:hypothetical protein